MKINFECKKCLNEFDCEVGMNEMGVGPQEHLDIIDKTFKKASNEALKGHFGDQKHTFKRKV